MKKEASKDKCVYKTELQLMQEAYDGCCGKPGCKHQMDAYRKHPLPYEPDEDAEWEDEYGDGDDDMFDSDMEGFKEETPESIDPADMSEILKDVKNFIKDKLAEFGYPESMVEEVCVELKGDDFDIESDYDMSDSSANYDEENYGFEDEEEIDTEDEEDETTDSDM